MKNYLVGFLSIVIFFSANVSWAQAQVSIRTTTTEERVALLTQIQKLLVEVLRLQTILEQRTKLENSVSESRVPYQLSFFDIPFEETYFVDSMSLTSSDQKPVRLVDRQIFDLFVTVIGSDLVSPKVKEWRVFNDEVSDLGAFVESLGGTDLWVVGVNRYGYEEGDKQTQKSFANLFIHEYAHTEFFAEPDFVASYKKRFWTTGDERNELYLKSLNGNSLSKSLLRYYDNNRNRFVSDYATISVDEDLAESFVSFVLEDKPAGKTISELKMLAFYEKSKFVNLRTKLRNNLTKADLLN